MPFEGKGIDLTETQWGDVQLTEIDSPVRINPSAGDYLSFRGDVSVDPGVVFQVAAGKGISFDGSCTQLPLETTPTRVELYSKERMDKSGRIGLTGACAAPAEPMTVTL